MMPKYYRRPAPGKSLDDIASPELRELWRGARNPAKAHLGMADFTYGSGEVALWFCPAHPQIFYPREIRKQVNKISCGYCASRVLHHLLNSVAATYPELIRSWHPTLNGGVTPDQVFAHSNTPYWWTCDCADVDDHEWLAPPNNRVKQSGTCPFVTGHRTAPSTSIATTHPGIAAQWVSEDAGKRPTDVSHGSAVIVMWQCDRYSEHRYPATVEQRTSGSSCSLCRGLRVDHTNSLEALRPDIAREWHPVLNAGLTPSQVAPRGGAKVWWRCPAGTAEEPHDWPATIANRTGPGGVGGGSGCPVCAGQRILPSMSLARRDPVLAGQWHPTRNGQLTPLEVGPQSDTVVWWKCLVADDHEWRSSIGNRSNGRGCPSCRLVHRSEIEVRISHELAALLPVDHAMTNIRDSHGHLHSVDIAVPSIQLVVEYDGGYWHQDQTERDTSKTNALSADGWHVIRIREDPLGTIPGSVSVPAHTGAPVYQIVAAVLETAEEHQLIAEGLAAKYAAAGGLLDEDGANNEIARLRRMREEKRRREVSLASASDTAS